MHVLHLLGNVYEFIYFFYTVVLEKILAFGDKLYFFKDFDSIVSYCVPLLTEVQAI